MANRQKVLLVLLGLTAAYYFYDLLSDNGGGIANIPIVKNLPVSILPEPLAQQLVRKVNLIIPGEGNLTVNFQGIWDLDPFYNPDFLEYLNRSSDGEFIQVDNLDSSFVLSGIVDEWVIIGGEVYELNNKVNGYTLSEIGDEYAILTLGNTNIRLELGGNNKDER